MDIVVHLNEVKDKFNALTSKLYEDVRNEKAGTEAKQFKRYGEWVEKGAKAGEARQVMIVVRNSGPGFNELLTSDNFKLLASTIGKNPDQPILRAGNREFSLNDLRTIDKEATVKLGELKKQNPSKSYVELSKEYFGSVEKASETLGKEYGTKVGGVK